MTTGLGTNAQVDVYETQKGSDGLSGEFSIDFSSPTGAKFVSFQESEKRFELKLEEFSTVHDVDVRRILCPSGTTGGWGANSVEDGTVGGYEWHVLFLRNPGSYEGSTFPPGSGNVEAVEVDAGGALLGTRVMVETKSVNAGSEPKLPALSPLALGIAVPLRAVARHTRFRATLPALLSTKIWSPWTPSDR